MAAFEVGSTDKAAVRIVAGMAVEGSSLAVDSMVVAEECFEVVDSSLAVGVVTDKVAWMGALPMALPVEVVAVLHRDSLRPVDLADRGVA